jgi:hypothetical protein
MALRPNWEMWGANIRNRYNPMVMYGKSLDRR